MPLRTVSISRRCRFPDSGWVRLISCSLAMIFGAGLYSLSCIVFFLTIDLVLPVALRVGQGGIGFENKIMPGHPLMAARQTETRRDLSRGVKMCRRLRDLAGDRFRLSDIRRRQYDRELVAGVAANNVHFPQVLA